MPKEAATQTPPTDNEWRPNASLNDVERATDRTQWTGSPVLVHSARTAVAAVVAVLAARLFRLPETYWAPIAGRGA
jgi:uncharacterized membrane protein YccC